MEKTAYENIKSLLGKELTIKIDRQMGSKHPKWGFMYPVNYGYIEGIQAPDGEELDAYLIGVFEPVEEFTGKCIAIAHRSDDNDDKMIICPSDKQYDNSAIMALIEFQEKFFKTEIIRS